MKYSIMIMLVLVMVVVYAIVEAVDPSVVGAMETAVRSVIK